MVEIITKPHYDRISWRFNLNQINSLYHCIRLAKEIFKQMGFLLFGLPEEYGYDFPSKKARIDPVLKYLSCVAWLSEDNDSLSSNQSTCAAYVELWRGLSWICWMMQAQTYPRTNRPRKIHRINQARLNTSNWYLIVNFFRCVWGFCL